MNIQTTKRENCEDFYVEIPKTVARFKKVYDEYGLNNTTFGEKIGSDDTEISRFSRGSFKTVPSIRFINKVIGGLFSSETNEAKEVRNELYNAFGVFENKKLFEHDNHCIKFILPEKPTVFKSKKVKTKRVKVRFCKTCGKELSLNSFYKNKDGPEGYNCQCIACQYKYYRKQANIEIAELKKTIGKIIKRFNLFGYTITISK